MKTLGIFFGGRSAEHDVSIVSAAQAMEAAKQRYNIVPVYIDRNGRWFTGDKLRSLDFFKHYDESQLTPCALSANMGSRELLPLKQKLFGNAPLAVLDIAMPVMHGLNGEDGTLQGLFELCGIPYTSAGVMGSAVGMDKIALKAMLRGWGFPVVYGCWFDRAEWERDAEATLDRVIQEAGFPAFVKPANLGSSIGISRATDRETLRKGIDIALHYDRRVLVEKGIDKPVEINCACLGWEGEVRASTCEQPVSWEEFLTFEDKYLRGGKGGKSSKTADGAGMAALSRQIPAPISAKLTEEIQAMSRDIFRLMDLRGVVRIDYMIDAAGSVFVTEVNTIPGSLAFYLWEFDGLPFDQLIDTLCDYAEKSLAEKQRATFAYDSAILSKVGGTKR